jgi:asparagine synthase (glutamine-hydrolysing)
MSGFFGILRMDGAAVEPRFLERVADRLSFRGPHGTCTWAKDGAGACFSFHDTATPHQASKQPVWLGERFRLLGEVRLDARRELVAELQRAGRPTTEESSDEELLLICWSVWGEAALARILGDFSFGLWDAESRALVCARDFVGARPFFYAWRGEVCCFSNTLELLRLTPGLSDDLDEFFVRDFLLTGLSSDPARTVWRDIHRLPAGHRLILSAGQLQVKRFRQLRFEEPLRLKQPEEYLENFRELLRQAVADRLPAGKVSLYLSGGLDSSSVCAMAAKLVPPGGTTERLKAFTTSWQPLFDDPEPRYAQLVARHLGLPHEILEESMMLPSDATSSQTTPEPTADLFFIRATRNLQCIAAHSPVVFSGDGGDNVLTGQAWPYFQYLRNRGDWGGIVRSFGGYFAKHRRFPPLRGGFRSRLRQRLGLESRERKIPGWLNHEFVRPTRADTAGTSGTGESLDAHPVQPQAYLSLHSGYWASVLEDEDAGSTWVLLETRAPFLDLRLLRFLLRLPAVPWCVEKEITRQAMRPWLPVGICDRPKVPLAQDPLAACQKKDGWRPMPTENPPKRIHQYVNWREWTATLKDSKGSLTWENLFPLAFSVWLKGIENRHRIQ